MLLSKTLQLFLDSIGRREEYEFYLRKFHADPDACFAAVVPDRASVEQFAELMAFDLQFLLRLDLVPLVILCGPDAAAMRSALFEQMEAEEVAPGIALEALADAIRAKVPLCHQNKRILLLTRPGETMDQLSPHLVPATVRRLHILRVQGSLKDTESKMVWYHLLHGRNPHQLDPGEADVVALAARCLAAWPQLHFSVASPLNLLKELFTVRGAGSIIRPGSAIHHLHRRDEIDEDALTRLIFEAFGRALREPAFLDRVRDFYIEANYRGAVLLEDHPAGKYLSKFAVGTLARGEGLGQEMWSVVKQEHDRLFWRSRVDNPFSPWYERHADGRQRAGRWLIYWRGIAIDKIPSIISYCADKPSDFIEDALTTP